MRNERKLSGKVILVTGANTGIGKAIAERCVSDGASVIVHGRREDAVDRAVKELGSEAFGVIGDLEDPAAPARIIAESVARYGRLDSVVNNAALVARSGFETTDADLFDRVMAVNVRAPFLICQSAIPHLKKARGCVLNIGSINGYAGESNLCAYSLSKGALQTLSKHLAERYAAEGVRVTHLNLGWVLTENEYEAKLGDGLPEGWPERLQKEDIPSGRMTQPNEVAAVAAFWLSDEARPFSGTVFELEQYPFLGRNPTKNNEKTDG